MTEPQDIDLDAIEVVTQSYSAPQDETAIVVREPAELLEQDIKVSKLLSGVIRDRGLISNIQGKQYVRIEGWTLLASWKHIYPVCVWTKPLHVNGPETPIMGFEARVEAHNSAGQIVSAAEARCTRDERNWKTRDEYALCSMAQTRATAKALRMPLGYVVVLAGYEATPAEEMVQEASGEDLTPLLEKSIEEARAKKAANLSPGVQEVLEIARLNREREQAKLDEKPTDRQKLQDAGFDVEPEPDRNANVCSGCGAELIKGGPVKKADSKWRGRMYWSCPNSKAPGKHTWRAI